MISIGITSIVDVMRIQMRIRNFFLANADPDPDPSFQIKAQTLEKVLK
jgi:hypothetical protein